MKAPLASYKSATAPQAGIPFGPPLQRAKPGLRKVKGVLQPERVGDRLPAQAWPTLGCCAFPQHQDPRTSEGTSGKYARKEKLI